MLLHCSTSYCQTNKVDVPSTGGEIQTVEIPITYIRKADSILIEYDYLKQSSIIKDNELKEYNIIVNDLNNKLTNIKKDNDKLKKKNKIFSWITVGTSIALVFTLIFK